MPNPTSFATSDGAELRVLERVLEGGVFKRPSELDTPAPDAYFAIPASGEGLAAPLTSKVSEALTKSGEYLGSTVVGGTSGGTVNGEMQATYFDSFLGGLVRNSFSAEVVVTGSSDITFTTGTNEMTSANVTPPFADFLPGRKFKVFLVSETTLHEKEFTVLSKTDDSTIVTVEPITATVANTSAVVKLMPHMVLGTDVRVFDIEKVLESNSGTYYANFRNQQVGAGQFTISPEDFVQAQFTTLGNAAPTYGVASEADSVTDVTIQPLMATTDLMELNLYEYDAAGGQGALVPVTWSNLTMNLDNGLREQKAPGSTFAAGIARNRFSATLNGSIYFVNYDEEAGHLAEKQYAVVIGMRDANGNGYIFEFNACKIQSVQSNASSVDADVDKPFNLQAFKHPVDSTVKVHKVPVE